ncbi:Gfo/Idh/MocA family protein [Paraburkholderia sediminicola]|uniref:Gfo/Idh/MocA family protein n=1 Tax=Paraburkholderia sediminicola TaxID=458836 RepID=UPI0038BDAAFA
MVATRKSGAERDLSSHVTRQPIRWGVVGAGHIAGRFAQGLSFVPDAELVGVWARRDVQAEEFARQYATHAYPSFDDLLENIDALYIATLQDSHSYYALRAFSKYRAVLCEKPAAVSARELKSLSDAAKAANVLFMEAMKPPFYPLFLRLTEHLAEDPIGEIGFVRAGCSIADAPAGHPSFVLERGGGALLNIGIYEAYLAVRFLGRAINVQTLGRLGQTGVDSFASLNILHEDGIAQIFCGLDLDGKGDAFLAGTKGSVTIHENWWNPSRATIKYLGGRTVELNEPFVGGGLNYETAHFCEVMRSGAMESPIITHDISMKMIDIIDAARTELGVRFPFEPT